MIRYRNPPLLMTLAMVLAAVLIVGVGPTGKVGAADLSSIRADSTLWIYGHRSRNGYRVADLPRAGLSGRRSSDEFARLNAYGYSPSQVRRAYEFDTVANDGHGQVIGIVNAFHYPTAGADLQHFIDRFRLNDMYGLPGTAPCTVAAGPHPCFQVIYAQASQPPVDGGWALESALDIQWAHAIAPGADILLVETANNLAINLLHGVDVAVAAGASVVSMSWGFGEVSAESIFDHHFNVSGVTFVAGSGDIGHQPLYPSVSPFVLAVGGTALYLEFPGVRIRPEAAWSASGGGIRPYVPEPGYQSDYPIPGTGGLRGNPDVAYNADPRTGFAVYDSTPLLGQRGWFVVGGTSAGGPQWAALTALANELRSAGNLSSNDLIHRPQYDAAAGVLYRNNYRDITAGTNGSCGPLCAAGNGYDFVTGLGSPRANNLVEFLAHH